MRVGPPVVAITVFALLGAACGGSGDTSTSPSESSATAPEVRAFLSLCSARAAVANEDVAGAEARFQDDVHEALHELASRLETSDRAVAGVLLEATSKIEADFLETAPDVARLGTDVDGLIAAMGDALAAAGLPTPGCPEASP